MEGAGGAGGAGGPDVWPRRRWPGLVADVVAAAAVLAALALPLAARASESRVPALDPPAAPALPPLADDPSPQLRRLPVVSAGGAVDQALADPALLTDVDAMEAALRDAAVDALGQQGPAFLAARRTTFEDSLSTHVYPDDPALDALVEQLTGASPPDDDTVARWVDLASLMLVASGAFPRGAGMDQSSVGPLVLRLLDRARTAGGCDAQLTFAFVLAADLPPAQTVVDELDTAVTRCPGDPTPAWLLGQFTQDAAVFERLQREMPGSPAGWAGQADLEITAAVTGRSTQPFQSLTHARRAISLLERARALAAADEAPGIDLGLGRARSVSGDRDGATAALRGALDAAPDASIQRQLVDALERAQEWSDAADEAGRVLEPGSYLGALPSSLTGARQPSLGSPALTVRSDAFVTVARIGPVPDRTIIPVVPPGAVYTYFAADGVGPTRNRDLVLAGRFDEVEVTAAASDDVLERRLVAIAYLEDPALADRAPPPEVTDPISRSRIDDDRQALWRWAGDLDRAQIIADEWRAREPTSERPIEQAGEIAFHRGEVVAAAELFRQAASLANSPALRSLDEVRTGVALAEAGTPDAALALFEGAAAGAEADIAGISSTWCANPTVTGLSADDLARLTDDAVARYFAAASAADVELREGELEAAGMHYADAREWLASCPAIRASVRDEALANDEGLVLATTGQLEAGLARIGDALSVDPANPVFLANRAWTLRKLGRLADAADAYRAALDVDPSSYAAANDLGVLLAEEGDREAAVRVLRQAIAANPGYATGWFNLALVRREQGVEHLLEAEGDLAKARSLDGQLREAEREPRFDDDIVFTTLDLADPMPPKGSFVAERRRESLTVGAFVVVLVGWRAVRVVARERIGDRAMGRLLGSGRLAEVARRFREPRLTPAIAAVATVALAVWPLVREGETAAVDLLPAVATALLVLLLAVRLHARAATAAAAPVRHSTWLPGIAVGVAARAVGLGFAPLPVAPALEPAHRQRRWLVPLVLGAVAAALVALAWLTRVPAARTAAEVAVVAAASTLLPIEPCDGGYIRAEGFALAVSIILLALCGILASGLV